ncbi:MAG: hypothetical protein ACJA1M_000832 [Alphaproteobacteria bacterium]|jgi:hypothetical protein
MDITSPISYQSTFKAQVKRFFKAPHILARQNDAKFMETLFNKLSQMTEYGCNLDQRNNLLGSHYKHKFANPETANNKPVQVIYFSDEEAGTSDIKEYYTHQFRAYLENVYKNDSHKIIILSDGFHENMAIIQPAFDGHKPKILLLELNYLLGNITKFSIEKELKKNWLGDKFDLISSLMVFKVKNFFNDHNDNDKAYSPQISGTGCHHFVHKYVKLLTANEGELLKQIEIVKNSETGQDHVLFPPELFRYSQSETFLTKYIDLWCGNTQTLKDKSPQEIAQKKQDITDKMTEFRENHYGKLHILYHIVKNYTGNVEAEAKILAALSGASDL